MTRPWWIALIAALAVAAGVAAPLLIAASAPDSAIAGTPQAGLLLKLFPAYAVAAGLCAWLCWPRRKELTWILLAILILSSAGLCLLLL